MGDDILIVFCTAPTHDKAEELARGLVDERLAACVNFIPGIRSVYRWEGTVKNEPENQLIIKTTQHRWGALLAWMEKHHPYAVPEVLAVPVARSSLPYARWVREETKPAP